MKSGSQRRNSELAKAIGLRVVSLRTCRGWNQTELAKRAQMERPILARLENGRHVPTLLTLRDVADAFGLGLAELLADVDRRIDDDAACAALRETA